MEILAKLREYVARGYVLHGSNKRLEVIDPRQANEYSDRSESNRIAVYATTDPRIALIFATIRLPASGSATLRIWRGDLQITVEGCSVCRCSGFVHILRADGFEHAGRDERISLLSVSPIDIIPVEPTILESFDAMEMTFWP